MTTQKPLQSAAQRQHAYRERKKRKKVYQTSYPYRRLREFTSKEPNGDAIWELINLAYDLGGERLAIKFCCFCNEFLSTKQAVQAGQVSLAQKEEANDQDTTRRA